MNLIDIYIQEVTRRLPEKSRADIALEPEVYHRGYASG